MTDINEEKELYGDEGESKSQVCSMCAKPSDTVICLVCEGKVRGEVLEHQHGINKAGRTDTGRR